MFLTLTNRRVITYTWQWAINCKVRVLWR